MEDWNDPIVQGSDIPVGCPDPRLPVITQTPAQCKPNAPSVTVYQDEATARQFITWDVPASHDYPRWGVTKYEVAAFDETGTELFRRQLPLDFQQPMVLNTLFAQEITVSACTEYQCGYEGRALAAEFEQGVSRVTNVQVEWQQDGTGAYTGQFRLRFDYPELAWPQSDGIPLAVTFKLESDFPQDETGNKELENIAAPAFQPSGWTSAWYDRSAFVGTGIRVTACSQGVGCGPSVNEVLTTPISSSDLPTPVWVKVGDPSNPNDSDTEIQLQWRFDGTGDLSQVDYIEVTEWSPRIYASRKFTSATGNNPIAKRVYAVDVIDRPLLLRRYGYGYYKFSLRACHRDREHGDVCSAPSGYFHETAACSTAPNCDDGSTGQHPFDFFLRRKDVMPWSASMAIAAPTNLAWSHSAQTNKYFVQWQEDQTVAYQPDYFYLDKLSGPGNMCLLEGGSASSLNKFTVDRPNKDAASGLWGSWVKCDDLKAGSQWAVSACINGMGCSKPVTVTIGDSTTAASAPAVVNQLTPDTIGGPGDLLPGMWWHPDLAGTGWHFYWASDLRYPSVHENYGKTYDLLGYWLAYKQERGVWTPVWFEARLVLTSDAGNTNSLGNHFAGALYYYSKSATGAIERQTVGTIQVLLADSCGGNAHNQCATLRIKPDFGQGVFTAVTHAQDLSPYTVEAGSDVFQLEIKDFAVDIIGNDVARFGSGNDNDHYAGQWVKTGPDGQMEAIWLAWIERDLEVGSFLTFDTAGMPVWLQGSTCDGSSCNKPVAGYFEHYKSYPDNNGQGAFTFGTVTNGFNPLAHKPIGHNYGGINGNLQSYLANAGRCFNSNLANTPADPERFRKGSFWFTVDASHNTLVYEDSEPVAGQPYSRTLPGFNGSHSCSSANALTKTASLHDIRYFVNGSEDDSISECDPNLAATGQCRITFNWFTDDDFKQAEPFFRIGDSGEYQPLTTICPGVPVGQYVVTGYECVLNNPGEYHFQLRKPSHTTAGGSVVIAESRPLAILPCASAACEAITVVADQSVAPVTGSVTHQPGAGPVPGQGGVNGGAATYHLPLVVPPGRHGMTPAVSLDYSSRGGNGILGVGWSLSVGSSIYHCPKTLAIDGVSQAVNFTTSDRLCLDGQRLILANGSTADSAYWAAGAEFRTEQDQFAKITRISSGYRVQTRDGRTRTYHPKGELGWRLVQESDSFGNTINYNYQEYGVNEYLLTSITYTGYGASVGDRQINFTYEQRSDANTAYQAGKRTDSTRKLSRITMQAPPPGGGSPLLVRQYLINTTTSTATGRLLLQDVSEVAGNESRLLFLNTWSQDASGSGWVSQGGNQKTPEVRLKKLTVDDLALIDMTTTELAQFLGVPESTLLVNPEQATPATATSPRGVSIQLMADFDGDGLKEVWASYPVAGSDGTSVVQRHEIHSYQLAFDQNGYKTFSLKTRINVPDTVDFTFLKRKPLRGNHFVDLDNDGRAEMVYLEDGQLKVTKWNNTHSAFETPSTGQPPVFADYFAISNLGINLQNTPLNFDLPWGFQFADMNNDALPDLLLYGLGQEDADGLAQTHALVYLNTTAGPSQPVSFAAQPIAPLTSLGKSVGYRFSDTAFRVVDLNGDGQQDVLVIGLFWTGRFVTIGNGSNAEMLPEFYRYAKVAFGKPDSGLSFEEKSLNAIGLGSLSLDQSPNIRDGYRTKRFYLLSDVNSDGLLDFIYLSDNSSRWSVAINHGAPDASDSAIAGLFSQHLESASGEGLYPTDCIGSTPGSACSLRYAFSLRQMDFDADGADEILLADPDNVVMNHCAFFIDRRLAEPVDWVACSDLNNVPQEFENERVRSFYSTDAQFDKREWDWGIYGYYALKFRLIPADGSIPARLTVQKISDPGFFSSPKKRHGNLAIKEGDFLGDGLVDLFMHLGCRRAIGDSNSLLEIGCESANHFGTIGIHSIIQAFIDEEYAGNNAAFYDDYDNGGLAVTLINQAVMPDMLVQVNKPYANSEISQSISWKYAPLSSSPALRESDFPLYQVPGINRYVDQDDSGDHFYFNSSMYVVEEMRESNGRRSTNGSPDQSITRYAYEEAVYNNKGRGFQGFRTIKVRHKPSRLHPYETESTSLFHQLFPLAGRLEKITTAARTTDSGAFVNTAETIYCYEEVHASPIKRQPMVNPAECDTSASVYDPASGQRIVAVMPYHIKTLAFDTDGANVFSKTIALTNHDAYGNPLVSRNRVETQNQGDVEAVDVKVQARSFAPPDTANWWVNKLISQTTHQKRQEDDGPMQTHTTYQRFIWGNGTARRLACQYTGSDSALKDYNSCTTNPPGIEVSRSNFSYDGYGNLTGTTTSTRAESPTGEAGLAQLLANALPVVGRSVATSYSSDGYFPISTTEGGLQTDYHYDPATGKLTQQINPDGTYFQRSYDAFGAMTAESWHKVTGGALTAPRYTRTASCGSNGCMEAKNALNAVQAQAQDLAGDAEVPLFAAYSLPEITYVVEQAQTGQPTRRTWYDSADRAVVSAITRADNKTTYQVEITNPAGVSEISSEPFAGSAASGLVSVRHIDGLKRVVRQISQRQTSAGLGKRNTTYQYSGWLTTLNVDLIGACNGPDYTQLAMSRHYDAGGKLRQTTDANGATVSYQYDASGNPKTLIDAAGNAIVTTYDALGRKQSVDDPNMGHKTFRYNGFGEVVAEHHGGLWRYFAHDGLGRITKALSGVAEDGSLVAGQRAYRDHYTYAADKLTAVTRADNRADEQCQGAACWQTHYQKVLDYHPDSGRLQEESIYLLDALTAPGATPGAFDSLSFHNRYYYHHLGWLKQVVYNDRYSVGFDYTPHGDAQRQYNTVSGATLMRVASWDTQGREEQRTYLEDQASSTWAYNRHGQITAINHSGGDNLSYAYDGWGNLKHRARNTLSESYHYDRLHRLVASQGPATKAYTYDNLGNLQSKSDFGSDYRYNSQVGAGTNNCGTLGGPNAVHQITLNTVNTGAIQYAYDHRGNRIRDCRPDGFTTDYGYDAANLLTGADSPAQQVRFDYAPDNQRYRKYDLAKNEITIYGPHGYQAVYRPGSASPAWYKYRLTGDITVTIGPDASGQPRARHHVLQKDRLGSVVRITGDDGSVQRKSYDAFGKPRRADMSDYPLWHSRLDFNEASGIPAITKRGFTGHEHLDELQLVHMNGRVYDFNNGRFLNVDPFIQNPGSTQSLNPYTYIFNNPLSGVDPSGYATCKESDKTGCLEDGKNTVTDGNGNTIATVIVANKNDKVNLVLSSASQFAEGSLSIHVSASISNGEGGSSLSIEKNGAPSDIGGVSPQVACLVTTNQPDTPPLFIP